MAIAVEELAVKLSIDTSAFDTKIQKANDKLSKISIQEFKQKNQQWSWARRLTEPVVVLTNSVCLWLKCRQAWAL